MNHARRIYPALCAPWILAAAIAGSVTASHSAEQASAGKPDANAILSQMAQFLAAQPRFSVDVACGYDSLQESGKKLEFLEHRKVLLDRPKQRLRVEVEQSDGDKSVVLFDGKLITAQDLTKNVYAQVDAKPTLDESIGYFVHGLRMRFPMAALLGSALPEELAKHVREVEYVEETSILGVPTYHVVGSTDSVDFQVWVDAGKKPLPHRIVLTYTQEEGQPQYRAQFSNWDLSPSVRDSAFEFKAPSGAGRITFAPQLKTVAATPASAAPAQGSTR
ncbi:MAG TPA: DUF2092 domain-containing protein [Candidatus Binatia bacterium]|jgi:hypothetical protein